MDDITYSFPDMRDPELTAMSILTAATRDLPSDAAIRVLTAVLERRKAEHAAVPF